jgi:hypothetical protein
MADLGRKGHMHVEPGMFHGRPLSLEGGGDCSVGDGSGRALLSSFSHPQRLATDQAASRCAGDSCGVNPRRGGA